MSIDFLSIDKFRVFGDLESWDLRLFFMQGIDVRKRKEGVRGMPCMREGQDSSLVSVHHGFSPK